MKVSIIEPNSAGHHFTYVRHIVTAIERLNWDFTLHSTPDSIASPEFQNHLGNLDPDRIDDSILPFGSGRYRIYRGINRTVDHIIETAKPDVILYPTADHAAVAVAMGRLTGNKLSKVHAYCMMTKLGFSYQGTGRRSVGWIEQIGLRASSWKEIGLVDVVALERLRAQSHPIASRLRLYPDPILVSSVETNQAECRKALGWELDKHLMVCPGMVRQGKGIEELLAGFLRLPPNEQATLIFAGPVRDNVRPAFATAEVQREMARGRIILYDRSLSTDELGQVIQAADVTCCVYPSHNHPSSIAVTSLAYNRPVLYSNLLWLGEMGPKFAMGYSCNPRDAESVASGMLQSIHHSKDWRRSPATEKLIEFQSASNYSATWEDTLRAIEQPERKRSAMSWDEIETV